MPNDPSNMGPTTGLAPHLTVKNGKAAIEFYKKAFGAKPIFVGMADDGKRIMHASLSINGAVMMLNDDFPEYMGGKATPPPSSAVTLHLQVKNADKAWEKALAAGAKVKMPIGDQFWGDRYGQVTDPFGHTWSIGSALKGAARKAAMGPPPPAPEKQKPAVRRKSGK